VPLHNFCGDILVVAVIAYIEVLVIPKQLGYRRLLGPLFPPIEVEVLCRRSLPPRGLV
jgi:hypothetical protein